MNKKLSSRISCKKNLFSIILIFLMTSAFCQNALPFSKGVNTFIPFFRDNVSINQMPALNVYDEADFECLKDMDVEVVRLACYFPYLMEPSFTGKISETILKKIDEFCDWAEENHIYLIIDNHGMGGADYETKTVKQLEEHLSILWPVLAKRYAGRSEYIMYEILNEPADPITTSQWQKVQQNIIDSIRQYDTKHTIIVTGSHWSAIDQLMQLKPFKDPNLIYTFHFYEPNLFTQQDESFSEELKNTDGIPFPYDKSRMPKAKAKDGTWFKEVWTSYPQEGTEKFLEGRIKKISDWAKKNNVNIFCGELGSGNTVKHSDRVVYNQFVTSMMQKYEIPYCVWTMDVGNGFFQDPGPGAIFPDDIDEDIVEAYGFSMPSSYAAAKTNRVIKAFPDEPFVLHDGVNGKWVDSLVYGTVKHSFDDYEHGDCLQITFNTETKSNGLKITPPKIISAAVRDNFNSMILSFSVKFTDSSQYFKVHFEDSDNGEDQLPWRSTYIVKASEKSINKWVIVEIPLTEAKETDGTWSDAAGKWFDSQGRFSWKRFSTIKFDFDNYDFRTGNVYIDDIVLKNK